MALRGHYKMNKNNKMIQTLQSNWTREIRKLPKNSCYHWLYEGQMLNDKYHGYGVLSKVYKYKTKKKYAGQWINGKIQGSGGFWYDNGNYYEGNFDENKKCGFGRMWYNDGSFYQGNWIKNLYDGNGLLIYANGNLYEGNFEEGKKSGRGIFYHFVTGQMQEGDWISDVCVESTMRDMNNRQSALKPTPYTIPMLST